MMLFAGNLLHAQIKVSQDSIGIIKDDLGNVGYVFPRKFAVEYLNIKNELLPTLNEKMVSLEKLTEEQKNALINLEQQKANHEKIIERNNEAIALQQETLNDTKAGLESVKRRLRFWKIGAAAIGISAFLLGFALGG